MFFYLKDYIIFILAVIAIIIIYTI